MAVAFFAISFLGFFLPASANAGVPGTLLDVQFFAAHNPYDLSAVKTGFAAIGQTTNDYWNGCSRDGTDPTDLPQDWHTYVAVTNLLLVDGTPTGAW
ncbi:MAG TPA: hypothetical protein VN048_15370, partial [Verrucomicrobiae bacterium]|nr:hypothetical protein [Verrucomicrobiae bacterium]